ncbi:MAG: hypothetical protein J3K34DRAFT_175768 [Monoraphidium minutum]|nr:MAG: hypothetical protein J3K34DRAFT_175768 [Monoraphidium minutum]
MRPSGGRAFNKEKARGSGKRRAMEKRYRRWRYTRSRPDGAPRQRSTREGRPACLCTTCATTLPGHQCRSSATVNGCPLGVPSTQLSVTAEHGRCLWCDCRRRLRAAAAFFVSQVTSCDLGVLTAGGWDLSTPQREALFACTCVTGWRHVARIKLHVTEGSQAQDQAGHSRAALQQRAQRGRPGKSMWYWSLETPGMQSIPCNTKHTQERAEAA